MNAGETIYIFEELDEQWIEWCLNCKHSYRKKNDADTFWCRLRKRKCPHLAERKEE